MEIKWQNITTFEGKKKYLNNNSFIIKDNMITGIYGDFKRAIPRILISKHKFSGNLLFNGLPINDHEITYIDRFSNNVFFTKLVRDEMYLVDSLKDSGYPEKVIASLKMVGLSEKYLEREINTLSKSEKRLLKLAINLLHNNELIIIDEPFILLDKEYKYRIKKIITALKKKYQKTLIILSNDLDVLNELSDELVIIKDGNILISDKKEVVFKNHELLTLNNIKLPDSLTFNLLANEKGINLTNYKDLKDIIKEVTKNVGES